MVAGDITTGGNQETVYRAYVKALERAAGELPHLVFVGSIAYAPDGYVRQLEFDPRASGKVLIVPPSIADLILLSEAAGAVVCPSVDDSGAFGLEIARQTGVPTIAADTAVNRRLAPDRSTFVNPLDTYAWVEALSALPGIAAQPPSEAGKTHPWDLYARQVRDDITGVRP